MHSRQTASEAGLSGSRKANVSPAFSVMTKNFDSSEEIVGGFGLRQLAKGVIEC